MTEIRPFKAICYNQEKIKDLSKVVCPPYDIISPVSQEYYHSLEVHNFIHILLGKDVPGEDKYRRAGSILKDWLKDEILIQDENPSIYFYRQDYKLKGEKKTRLGFVALLHLIDDNPFVFGHEHTRLEPKEDRLRLLKQVRANLSPIFVLFFDKKRTIAYIYQKYAQDRKPFIDIKDDENTLHKLWRLDSADLLAKLQSQMKNEKIFIADGHHRYEVALAYRDEMKKKLGTISGEESFNYVLSYFTNIESKGLTILPIHRLVKLDANLNLNSFMLKLRDYFDIEEVKDKIKFFFLMEKAGRTEHLLGMYKDRRFLFLRLKNIRILDNQMRDKPKEFRSLDVSILNYIVLRKILELDLEDRQRIVFNPNADELIEKVDNDISYVTFFLNPVQIQQMISVALNGEKMPTKSTYFYPKVLSGLVINKFE